MEPLEDRTATSGPEAGAWSIDQLISDLDSERSTLRCQAARRLGELKARSAVGPLIRKLAHFDNNTKIAAAQALGEIGDPRAVDPLILAMRKESMEPLAAIQAALVKLNAQDSMKLETTVKNIRKGIWRVTRPGVWGMLVGGGIILFMVTPGLIRYIVYGETETLYWIPILIIGLGSFLRGLIRYLSN
jgi:hypothetical protein